MDIKAKLNGSAKVIIAMLTATKADSKDKLLIMAKAMKDAAMIDPEKTAEEKENYKNAVEFIENLWRDDFNKIFKIVFDEKKDSEE